MKCSRFLPCPSIALAPGLALAGLLWVAGCADETPKARARDQASTPAQKAPAASTASSSPASSDGSELARWQARIDRYANAELTADISHLSAAEKQALHEIIAASRLLEPIYDRQVWAGNPALLERLEKDQTPLGQAKLTYVKTHRGPWDRQEHFAPFATDKPHPKGAGFYPEDLTEQEFKTYVTAHPEKKAALESLTTVVVRKGDGLDAVPYSVAYRDWLVPAAEHLKKAAALTENATLKRFLTSRAAAFLSDDYYQSDKDWMDLDSAVEVTIGPYEVYEDLLFGYKASFESYVTITDPEASQQLAKFKELLPAMEQHLPVDDEVKTKRGGQSPIRVVDLVFTAGDARKSVQTIAFNLPNDERVRKEKGAKKVMLRNLIKTKFERIMKPIAAQVLAADQQQFLSADAFFDEVLFHELSHSLGPAFVHNAGKVEVRMALGSSYSAIEEAKADVMGAYNILFLVDKGEFEPAFRQQLLASYFAGLFRSVRFGVAEAHGRGAALQINRFLEAGGATFDGSTKTFRVDFDKLEAAITKLVHDLCMLQHEGDKAKVDALLDQYGVMSPSMQAALDKLHGVPVDIRPFYPLAGESAPK